MGKYVGDCRLTHYGALLRKALDDAGYDHIPILTNDDADSHNMHPGFKLNLASSVKIAFAFTDDRCIGGIITKDPSI